MSGGWERYLQARMCRPGREEGQRACPAQAPAAWQAQALRWRPEAASQPHLAGGAGHQGLNHRPALIIEQVNFIND